MVQGGLADYIGVDSLAVIAANELATEKKPEKQEFWGCLLDLLVLKFPPFGNAGAAARLSGRQPLTSFTRRGVAQLVEQRFPKP